MNTLYIVLTVLFLLFLLTHYLDLYELKKFRINLIPGNTVLVEIDDEKYAAVVKKSNYTGDMKSSSCDIQVMIDETPYELTIPLESVYKYYSFFK